MLPIAEVKELMSLLVSGVNTGLQIAKDGKVSLEDIPSVFEFLKKVPAAFENIGKVPAELADLDAAEAAELIDLALSELALGDNAKAKNIVEASLKLLSAGYSLVMAIKG